MPVYVTELTCLLVENAAQGTFRREREDWRP